MESVSNNNKGWPDEIAFNHEYQTWTIDLALENGQIKVPLPHRIGASQPPIQEAEECHQRVKQVVENLKEIQTQAIDYIFNESEMNSETRMDLITCLRLVHLGFWSNGDLQALFNGGDKFGGHHLSVSINADGRVDGASIK